MVAGRPYSNSVFFNLAVAISLLIVLLVIMPWAPSFPAHDLESSWQLGMNVATAKQWRFGTEVVFTFGPLSAAFTRAYYPGIFSWALLTNAFLGAFLVLAFARQVSYRRFRSLLVFGWAGLITLITAFYLKDALFLIVPYIAFMTLKDDAIRKRFGAFSWFSLGALAVISLVKTSFAIGAIAVLFVFALFQAMPVRFRVLPLATYLVMTCLLWVCTGQQIHDLPQHVSSSLPIVDGYSDAMSIAGDPLAWIGYMVGAGAIVAIAAHRREMGEVVAFGAVLFLAFKAAYVRHDIHEIIGAGVLLMAALLTVATRTGLIRVVPFVVGICVFILASQNQVRRFPKELVNEWGSQFSRSKHGIVSLLQNSDAFERTFHSRLDELGKLHPLPLVGGSVDIYSFDQVEILANRMSWNPRPVLQSYSAYSSELAKLNALHVTSPKAPDNIFFQIQPIDGRFAPMDDGLSWPAIWSQYRLARRYERGLHFVREESHRIYRLNTLQDFESKLGSENPIPGNAGLIWAELEVSKSTVGKIASLLFRPPALRIEILTSQGKWEGYRFIPRVGAAGFLISPLITSTDDFADVTRNIELGHRAPGNARAFRIIQEESLISAYHDSIKVKLKTLDFDYSKSP